MKRFWDIIYAHGPALVFNGHTHVYERYEPMDPAGNKCPAARGIQQFIISPGGSKSGGKQRENARTLPAVYSGDAQHVGFFSLWPDGRYRFVIRAVDKDNRVSEIDSGGGRLQSGSE